LWIDTLTNETIKLAPCFCFRIVRSPISQGNPKAFEVLARLWRFDFIPELINNWRATRARALCVSLSTLEKYVFLRRARHIGVPIFVTNVLIVVTTVLIFVTNVLIFVTNVLIFVTNALIFVTNVHTNVRLALVLMKDTTVIVNDQVGTIRSPYHQICAEQLTDMPRDVPPFNAACRSQLT